MNGAVRNICLALLLAVAFGVFTHRYKSFESSNELSRLYLATAIVEEGTFHIDDIIKKWGDITDKSQCNGRYYSDKAPGASLIALPAVLLLRAVSVTTGIFFGRDDALSFVRIITIILPSLFFLLYLLGAFGESPLKKFSDKESAIVATVLVYVFATPVWVYSTLLYGHQLSAMAGFTSYLLLLRNDAQRDANSKLRFFIAGVLAGLCPVIEYPCVWITTCLVIYALLTKAKKSPFFWLGMLIPLFAIATYHKLAFGSPFATAYSFKVYARDANFHEGGLWGVSLPSFDALVGILLSRKRGLFFYSPILIAVLPGFVRMGRLEKLKKDFLFCLAVVIGHTLIIAGFKDWTAGWSFGARHLVPMLPFLVPHLLIAFDRATKLEKIAMSSLAGVSVLNHALAVFTFVHVPVQLKNPITDLFIALFKVGDVGPMFIRGGKGVAIATAVLITLVIIVTISYLLARANSRVIKAFSIGASLVCGLLWVLFFAGLRPQESDDKHFAMSQVYSAVGDIESVKRELKPMTLPFKPRDLRIYGAYTLWKIAEEEGDVKSAVAWRRFYMRLIGVGDDELKEEGAP